MGSTPSTAASDGRRSEGSQSAQGCARRNTAMCRQRTPGSPAGTGLGSTGLLQRANRSVSIAASASCSAMFRRIARLTVAAAPVHISMVAPEGCIADGFTCPSIANAQHNRRILRCCEPFHVRLDQRHIENDAIANFCGADEFQALVARERLDARTNPAYRIVAADIAAPKAAHGLRVRASIDNLADADPACGQGPCC